MSCQYSLYYSDDYCEDYYDSNECFESSIHKRQKKEYKRQRRDNATLQQWLNIRHYFKSMGNESKIILSSVSNDIINAFGGINDVVKCLINNGNNKQLKLMLDIIKKQKMKYDKNKQTSKFKPNNDFIDDHKQTENLDDDINSNDAPAYFSVSDFCSDFFYLFI